MGKVERSARAHGTDREEGAAMVEALIERYLRSGLLDDKAYAEAKAASLTGAAPRRGHPGEAGDEGAGNRPIDAALETVDEETPGDTELAAAVAFARRRRLGPFRTGGRAEHRDKDLAALGRVGFSYQMAKRVVDAEDPDNIEEITNKIIRPAATFSYCAATHTGYRTRTALETRGGAPVDGSPGSSPRIGDGLNMLMPRDGAVSIDIPDDVRVVVAEDDRGTRLVLRGLLRSLGIREIIECANGAEAFVQVQRSAPDLLISDWEMPEVSGIALTRLVRNHPDSPNPLMPVIMLTSHSNQSLVARARDAGVTAFLAKPVSRKALAARLEAPSSGRGAMC